MKCRNCNSNDIKKIIFIGKQPLSGIFLKRKNYNLKKYSLDLYICKKCDLVQIGKNAPESKMFGDNYGYQSSISKLMTAHLKKIYQKLITKKFINNTSSVLDIGSNDGTFLNFFKKTNTLFGVDPSSNKFRYLYNHHIKRINNFFSYKNVQKFFGKNKNQKFDLISSIAMFYDVNDPNKFCKDIFKLLKPNGIWILELSYFPLLLKNLTYDQICHEHVTYYTLNVFKKIVEKNDFKVIETEINEINGGSIQIICAKKDSIRKIKLPEKIRGILKDEKKINLKSYQNFNNRISNLKNKINLFFHKNKKRKIYGYGASTKGNIVLNYCKISNRNLSSICDSNVSKVGFFTPGSNIEIISKEKMRLDHPDFLIVFIWSFRKEVIKQEMNFIKKGGKLIFLLPRFHIVESKNYKTYLKKNFQDQSYRY